MNAAAATSTSTSTPAPPKSVRRKCCMKNSYGGNCTRNAVWSVDNIGLVCNYCWQIYFDDHWREIDLDWIHRLSDEEKDFRSRPELEESVYIEKRKKAGSGNGNGSNSGAGNGAGNGTGNHNGAGVGSVR